MTPSPSQTPPVKPLAAAETAVRRLLLMVGFGFMAFVGGSTIAVSITGRIAQRLEGSSDFARMVAGFLVEGAWVIFALPAIGYIAGRFLEVRPWPTAIIGAGTGMMFQLALQYVSSGEDGILGDPVRQLGRLGGAALGIVLTAASVRTARAAAKIAEDKARLEAEKKKTQYDEFVKSAEALAERREQVPIAPPAPAEAAVEAPKPETPATQAAPPPEKPPT